MNSKESLNNIKNLFIGSPINPTQQIEIIEKDLEILEILKNKNVDVDLIKNIMKDNRKFECYPDDNLTQEEFELVKEWLENDNN